MGRIRHKSVQRHEGFLQPVERHVKHLSELPEFVMRIHHRQPSAEIFGRDPVRLRHHEIEWLQPTPREPVAAQHQQRDDHRQRHHDDQP